MDESPCQHCIGACCRVTPGLHNGVSLSNAEAKNPIFKGHLKKDRIQGTMLTFQKSGKCPFLDSSTYQCRIYNDRPQMCQEYTCLGSRADGPLALAHPVVLGWLNKP